MKKIISLLLAAVLLCTCLATSAFAGKSCDCGKAPLIVVSGMGACSHINTETGKTAFPPSVDAVKLIKTICTGLVKTAVLADANALVDMIIEIANDLLGPMACNENGESLYPYIDIPVFEKSMAEYEGFFEEHTASEFQLLHTSCDEIGADHTYFFNYDWRLDPMDTADDLKDFIQKVKEETGHDKVDLAPCSMGGTRVMAYFSKYLDDNDVDSCLFVSAAYNGTYIASQLFGADVNLSSDAALSYISTLKTGNEFADNLITLVLNLLKKSNTVKGLFGAVNTILDKVEQRAYDEVLKKTFGTMPGMWSLVRTEYYEAAKEKMLSETTPQSFIDMIDEYQYDVFSKRKEILDEAIASGVSIGICSNYDKGCVPVYEFSTTHGDMLIETVCTSGGAAVADMFTTLGDSYVQAEECSCGKNHVSVDNVIDASTCMHPDYTWFFKGLSHVGALYGSDYNEFIMWFMNYEGQPTVWSDSSYPQFLQTDSTQMTLKTLENTSQWTLTDYTEYIVSSIKNLFNK